MEIIHKYFPDLSSIQYDRLAKLENLYNDWNQKINLISRKDISQLYERHVLYSMSIGKFFSFRHPLSIMDVGTGGGFPGIPLAIIFPESEFLLVDSTGKKIKVVKDIIDKTGLKNCNAIHERAENIKSHFDFIVSRAVTNFDDFANRFKNMVKPGQKSNFPNGIIYLKGGDFEEEIRKFRKNTVVYSLSDVFDEEFFTTKKIIYLKIK